MWRLKHYRWDLVKAVDRQKGTIAHPGSEFREMSVVEELWKDHESWTKMKSIMTDGVDYPLVDIVEEDRRNDLDHMIKCGNHMSARKPQVNAETLRQNYKSEVDKGWMLPIPERCLHKLKGKIRNKNDTEIS